MLEKKIASADGLTDGEDDGLPGLTVGSELVGAADGLPGVTVGDPCGTSRVVAWVCSLVCSGVNSSGVAKEARTVDSALSSAVVPRVGKGLGPGVGV